jgi:hypothetical protein
VNTNKDSGETRAEAFTELDRNQTKEEDDPLFSATFLLIFSLPCSTLSSRESGLRALGPPSAEMVNATKPPP